MVKGFSKIQLTNEQTLGANCVRQPENAQIHNKYA